MSTKTHKTAPVAEHTAKPQETLHVAFELSRKTWKLAFSDGKAARPRIVTIAAQDWEGFRRELEKARLRFGLSENVRVVTCYEVGRESFWIHRALKSRGIENLVVDSASIEVNRRDRRAKTDRMDAEKLVRQLIRYMRGEADVWSVVRVPDEKAEDARQLHRDIEVLSRERTQHRVRIQSLLFTQGIDMKVSSRFSGQLSKLRRWDDSPLPEQLQERLRREYQRLQTVEADLKRLRQCQQEKLRSEQTPAAQKVQRLQQLRGIGLRSSWMLTMELFGWRQFRNRRELAGAMGIVPTPYQSGDSKREQGISRSGNRRVRAMAVELAWSWLRLQPNSELSRWYRKRFSSEGARMRKIGIVAMARRLMIDLWRYLEQGVVPAGARLKAC